MKKRSFVSVLFVLVLMMSMVLSACGGKTGTEDTSASGKEENTVAATETTKEGEESTPTEDVKLAVWIAGSGEVSADQAYRAVLDAYCALHTNVSYELTSIPWGEYFTKLNTGLIGGAGPDIFMLGYGQMGSVQGTGDLMPLNSYIPEDWDGREDFYENILSICEKDDELYGLFKPSTRTFMYRKDIAEQNGVTEEDLHVTSQDELLELIKKMTVFDANGKTEVYGFEMDPDGEQQFFTFLSQLTDNPILWNEDYTAAFNNEAGVTALENVKRLVDGGYACLQDPSVSTQGLSTGISAISLGADSLYTTADDAFPGQIGVIKNDMNTLLIGDYIAVNKNTKYPDVATDMFLHIFSKESCATFAEVQGQYSGRKSLEDSYLQLNPDYENIINSYQYSVSYGTAMHPKFSADITFLRSSLESVFYGEDAQAILNNAAAEWNSNE